jgi:hypothetical protein
MNEINEHSPPLYPYYAYRLDVNYTFEDGFITELELNILAALSEQIKETKEEIQIFMDAQQPCNIIVKKTKHESFDAWYKYHLYFTSSYEYVYGEKH